MANTRSVYLNRDQLGLSKDNLPEVLLKTVADVITEEHINNSGRIEVLLVVYVDHPDIIVPQSAETSLS
jgi:hypothetical protein